MAAAADTFAETSDYIVVPCKTSQTKQKPRRNKNETNEKAKAKAKAKAPAGLPEAASSVLCHA